MFVSSFFNVHLFIYINDSVACQNRMLNATEFRIDRQLDKRKTHRLLKKDRQSDIR